MSSKKSLSDFGRASMNEDDAAKIGAQKLRDIVIKALNDAGVENPPSVKVSLVNGEELTILGPEDPQLDRPASDVRRDKAGRAAVSIGTSAKGGM